MSIPSPIQLAIDPFQFDDLAPGTKLAGTTYKHLKWNDVTVVKRGSRDLKPNSAPNYGLSGPYPNETYPAPSFGITGDVPTFTLDSFYAGCLSTLTNKPVTCRFIFQCRSATDHSHEGPILFTYVPTTNSKGVAPLQQFLTGFKYCLYANGGVYTSDAGVANTVFAIDDVSIGYRKA